MDSIGVKAQNFLGPQYVPRVRLVLRSGAIDTVIITARNAHNPRPETYFEFDDVVHIFSGQVADELSRAQIRSYFRDDLTDQRPLRRSPGGFYSYASVRKRDGHLWASQSVTTLEPVYYSQSDTGAHVGNHPLLVHMAQQGFAEPHLDEDFYFRAVSAGAALDNSTPFRDCHRLGAEVGLVGSKSGLGVQVVQVPRPDIGEVSTGSRIAQLRSLHRALREAGSVLDRLPTSTLLLSGGKDSRLLAALVKREGYASTPVNQNLPQEVEGQVADAVAARLGFAACSRVPFGSLLRRTGIAQATRRRVAYSSGLPTVAALQYASRPEGPVPGAPLLMGHAHLQRGGLNAMIRTADRAIKAVGSRIVNPHLLPEYTQANLRRAQTVVSEHLDYPGARIQRVSFHAYLRYSVNYQLQSLYAYTRNWNPLVTPLIDERFALACEAIADAPPPSGGRPSGIVNLVTEWHQMALTALLAPSLLTIPLAGTRYKCDRKNRPGYRRRDPEQIQARSISPEVIRKGFDTRLMDESLRAELWEQIEATPVADLVRQTGQPDVVRYLSEPHSPLPAGYHPVALHQFCWNVYGQSVILGTPWWKELSSQSR
ncbi:MAG: hypothetical protein ACK5KU_10110 [Beutenbergiaceae bacterium]